MIDVALLSFPVFAVVALGWLATRLRLTSSGTLDALGAFSFRFALPALVLRLIAAQPLGQSFNGRFFAGYLAAGGAVFALVLMVSRRWQHQTLAVAAARATTATVSNVGFLGPPLVLAFFGERGAGPLAMAIVAEVLVLMSVGAILMGSTEHKYPGLGAPLRGAIRNPVIASIAIGTAMAAAGIRLPGPLDRFLGFLGAAAGPTALFALGGALALQRIDRTTALAAATITLVKLVGYPLVIGCVLSRIVKVEPFWIEAGVLIASLPSAGSNYVLAQRYAADAERVSAAIVLSTIASVATVPLAAWLVLHG